MLHQIVVLAVLAAVAHAGGIGLGGVAVDLYTVPNYGFNYGVADPSTGDRKEQNEVRKGDVVQGEYSLDEPDGTIRVVKYTSDPVNGFNAIVSRIGKAGHPVTVQRLGGIGLAGGLGGKLL